jgi:hypothetical protein
LAEPNKFSIEDASTPAAAYFADLASDRFGHKLGHGQTLLIAAHVGIQSRLVIKHGKHTEPVGVWCSFLMAVFAASAGKIVACMLGYHLSPT